MEQAALLETWLPLKQQRPLKVLGARGGTHGTFSTWFTSYLRLTLAAASHQRWYFAWGA